MRQVYIFERNDASAFGATDDLTMQVNGWLEEMQRAGFVLVSASAPAVTPYTVTSGLRFTACITVVVESVPQTDVVSGDDGLALAVGRAWLGTGRAKTPASLRNEATALRELTYFSAADEACAIADAIEAHNAQKGA